MFKFDLAEVGPAVAQSAAFKLAARFWTGRTLLKTDDGDAYLLEVRDGEFISFKNADPGTEAEIIIAGPKDSWEKLFEAIPPAGFHDPLYNDGRSGFRFEDNLVANRAPYFHAVQEFLDVLRRLQSGGAPVETFPEVDRDFDAAVGRYMYVRIQGVQYRIYYEEAGEGKVPLILQHTAGADGRQWRHILEDPDFRNLYRIVSYDLPYHGKSIPPTSIKWWEKPYVLTRGFLMDSVVAIAEKLKLDRPVFMGCSVGGMLAPDLAFYRPDKFRAVIAINGGLAHEIMNPMPGYEESLSGPRVGAQWKGAMMRSNTAPTSPEPCRRETSWVYMQGAPAVLEGDVYYYMVEHDLSAAQAAQIDTQKVGVYLLTGEYDFLAGEHGTADLAAAIKGSHYQLLPGLGHFGPVENPEGFKKALLPVLQEIAAKTLETAS